MALFIILPDNFEIPDKIKNDSHPDVIEAMKEMLTKLKTDGVIYREDYDRADDSDWRYYEAWSEIYYDYKDVFKKYYLSIKLWYPDYHSDIINLNKYRKEILKLIKERD